VAELGWLTRALPDVPEDDRWLTEREREILSRLRAPKRRAEWRLGRWTAKQALAVRHGVAAADVEVLAAADGAPEPLTGGEPMPAALSISHRAGRALAVVARGSTALGCDLEAVEPRSPAFVRRWLRPDERELLAAAGADSRDLAANLLWTAKEAAAKARREGLRLDLRDARVDAHRLGRSIGAWERLEVGWTEGSGVRGWWRSEPGWVMAVVSEPASADPPSALST
jgi:4'-phosphopantetheinyl transferase